MSGGRPSYVHEGVSSRELLDRGRIQGSRELKTGRNVDLEAVGQVLAGDREAFGDLVNRWQDRVYGTIFRMVRDPELARDLSQETFLKAFGNLAKFRGQASFGSNRSPLDSV